MQALIVFSPQICMGFTCFGGAPLRELAGQREVEAEALERGASAVEVARRREQRIETEGRPVGVELEAGPRVVIVVAAAAAVPAIATNSWSPSINVHRNIVKKRA